MKCVSCGKEINENQKFCKYCGARVENIKPLTVDKGQFVKCNSCGAELKSGTMFCTQCGNPIVHTSTDKKEDKPNKKKLRFGRIVFLTIAVLAIVTGLSFLGYFLITKNSLLDLFKTRLFSSQIEDNRLAQMEESGESIGETVSETINPELVQTVQEDNGSLEKIDLEYEMIADLLSSGTCETNMIENGVTAYIASNDLVCIKDERKTQGVDCTYYYSGGTLVLAEYAGNDLSRFFFDNDTMIRWRYFNDKTDVTKYTDYDNERTTAYLEWEENVLKASGVLVQQWNNAKNNPNGEQDTSGDVITLYCGAIAPVDDFWFPQSSSSYLTSNDLSSLYDDDPVIRKRRSQLAINEIFVRYGYTFQTDSETAREAKAKFENKEWYQIAKRSCPSNDQNDLSQSYFNEYEKANVKSLLAWQDQYAPD